MSKPAVVRSIQQPHDGMLEARIEHLRKIALFSEVQERHEALLRLSELMCERVYQAGSVLIKEGENGSELFIVISGQASIYKTTQEGDQYKVAIIHGKNHAVIGEGALLDADSRSATIIADTECHCLILDQNALDTFGKEYPQFALPIFRRIARMVMSRLRKTNEDLSLLYKALLTEIRNG